MRYDRELEGDTIALLGGFNWWRGRKQSDIQAQDRANEARQAASVARDLAAAQTANASAAAVRAQRLAVAQANAQAAAAKAADEAAIAAATAPASDVVQAPVDASATDDTTSQTPDTGGDYYYGFDFQKNAPIIGIAALAALFVFHKPLKKMLKIR
jgi:multidrug efflux pump subunit AcrA (membrane-fusion protein)